jgi:hypothetical protein
MRPAGSDTGVVGAGPGSRTKPRRVVAIAPEALEGPEALAEILRGATGGGLEVRVVVPAVEETQLRHAFGDVDDSARAAALKLEASLMRLRRDGISARGEVGDPDPVLAAEDALREEPADEVVIFDHVASQRRWFENGLFERAQEALDVPLRMVHVRNDGDAGWAHVVAVEEVAADAVPDGAEEAQVVISDNLPRFSTLDFGGMVMGVVGTIVAIVLAAAGPGPESGWGAASILIAIAISLINMAHVVGLTLFESVRYRGGWETFFHTLALVGTPLAVLVNLLILLFA